MTEETLEELLKRKSRKTENLEDILKRKKRENVRPKKESVNPTDYTVYDYSPPVDILKLNKKRKKGFEFSSFNFNYKPVKDVWVNTIDSVMNNYWNMRGPIISGAIIGAIGVGLYLLSTSYIEDYKSKDKSAPLSQSSVSSQQNPISNALSTVYDTTTNSVSDAVNIIENSFTKIIEEQENSNSNQSKTKDETHSKYIVPSTAAQNSSSEIYRYVDESGKVNYTNTSSQPNNITNFSKPSKITYENSIFRLYDDKDNLMYERDIESNQGNNPYGQSNNFDIMEAKFGDVDGDGEKEIIVIGNHKSSYPGQVTIWETDGDFKGRYWNPGHLESLLTYDIDKDGKEEIIVGGVNTKTRIRYDTHGPALFALDEEKVIRGGIAPTKIQYGKTEDTKWYHYVDTDFDSKGITSLKIRNNKIIGECSQDYGKLKICTNLDGTVTKCD